MEPVNSSIAQLRGLAGHYAPGLLITVLSLVALVAFTSRLRATGEPQSLSDPIPFVFNTLQFLTNNEKFMKRVM